MEKIIATYHKQNVDDLILRADTTLMWQFGGGYAKAESVCHSPLPDIIVSRQGPTTNSLEIIPLLV